MVDLGQNNARLENYQTADGAQEAQKRRKIATKKKTPETRSEKVNYFHVQQCTHRGKKKKRVGQHRGF